MEKNKEQPLNNGSTDCNGMSTCLGLFYAKRIVFIVCLYLYFFAQLWGIKYSYLTDLFDL